ncbi:hypothetical protein PVK06_016446 [Gossypium arboreum]|uniref:Uncharacterized protein n=1 Tax=Gossypium arboreum TaxID=29729 RepID=A0ABR0Q158_GOSAR|nr:hypothetical protein PVK06_016446 [Gossypium arboreum]
MLLDPKRGMLKHISRQFDSSSLMGKRKRFCVTINNCCFEAENQLQILLLILSALLLPIAGNKIYSEQYTKECYLHSALTVKLLRIPRFVFKHWRIALQEKGYGLSMDREFYK